MDAVVIYLSDREMWDGTWQHLRARSYGPAHCDYFASVAYPDLLELGLQVVKTRPLEGHYEVRFS